MLDKFLFSTSHEGMRMNGKIIFLFQVELVGSERILVGIIEVG